MISVGGAGDGAAEPGIPSLGRIAPVPARARARRREGRRQRLDQLLGRHRREERLRRARQRRGHAGGSPRENLRRDHHHELGLILVRGLALEQQAEDRDVADARDLLQRGVHRVVDQAGDGERLAVLQIDLGLGATRAERGDPESLEQDAVGEVERADLGSHLQVHAIAVNHRREVQPHAEFLVGDRDRQVGARSLRDRHRELAAGEEARFLAALGDQVRLGEALELPFGLQRLDHRAELVLGVEEKQVEEVAEDQLPGCSDRSCRRSERWCSSSNARARPCSRSRR